MRLRQSKLWRDDGAAVAPIIALSMIGLVAAGGLAFDYARLASLDTELQGAADQAALAAATQLNGQAQAMERAISAAQELVANDSRFANDGDGAAVAINPDTVLFYATKADAEADTNSFSDTTRFAEAKFVRVEVLPREAVYTLTPIVDLFRSGDIMAAAVAGLGDSICKVPPLMLCNPSPGTAFDPLTTPGKGIAVFAKRTAWAPGAFGFMGPGDTPSTEEGMAYQNPTFECQSIDTGEVNTGVSSPALDAVNTRFDIYNFGGGGGSTLGACTSGACPAAANVVKDLVRDPTNVNNNMCKIHNNGWQLLPVAERFTPDSSGSDSNGFAAMGLPRDNCDYTSFGTACTGGRVGDGNWARSDYFNTNHPGGERPPNPTTITRYETYRWEIDNGYVPGTLNASGSLKQQGAPVCSTGALDPARDRRVLTVAIAENCASLHGSSTAVTISDWWDMFFVEPAVSGRGNGQDADEIYLEFIAPNLAIGGTSADQVVRRSVPYLVK